MSETTDARGSAVGRLYGRKQQVVTVIGVVFWSWLLARWLFHNTLADWLFTTLGAPDLIQSELGVSQRNPWLPAKLFEAAAETLTAVGAGRELIGVPVGWFAWLFELASFAVTTGPALAAGAFVTVYLTLCSMLFGLGIAVPVAVARVYGSSTISHLSLVYTELIRGTPLLAQLFFFYFGLPLAGLISDLRLMELNGMPRSAAVVAIIAFTVNSSAYQAEYIRSALQSVDRSQLTAARSIGLSRYQGIRHVVLPQGLRLAIPGWTNELIYLLKYSSLAAFITVPELFRRARNIGSDTFQFVDIYVIVGLFYLALVITTAVAMEHLESRVTIPGIGQSFDRN